ncbi:MAG: FixH family protein [Burkholderiaceae bacterium]
MPANSSLLASSAARPSQRQASGAWWQNRWPWIILGMLGSTILACMITIVIAVKTQDSLVADDYTRHGKGINQRLEKDQEATRRGITLLPTASRQPDGAVVFVVVYSAPESSPPPEFLRLQLAHPTIGAQDRSLAMVQTAPGRYQAQATDLMAGYWHLSAEDPQGQWRVRSRLPIDP